jgi:hypothetical protein
MKFKYCKNNCFDYSIDSSAWYLFYKCDCNSRCILTIRKNLYLNNEFKLSAIMIDNLDDASNLNKLLLFIIVKNKDLNLIHIKLDNTFVFYLDYESDDQYILDKIIVYWENMIFE